MTDVLTTPRPHGRSPSRILAPVQALTLGFAILSLVGAGLLMLPVATTGGRQSAVDALFVATSAVSTTGLSVVDVGSYYSLFGQVVILILFQIGGIGYMTFVVFVATLLGRTLSLHSNRIVEHSLAIPSIGEARRFIKKLIAFSFLFELGGATALALYWWPAFGFWRAAYLGIFHAVSAFCTAGFALFTDSFSAYHDDFVVNLILSLLSIGGGIGFLVLSDLHNLLQKVARNVRPRRLSTHSKLALYLTIFFAAGATLVLFIAEGRLSPEPTATRLLQAVFQAISASTTTGFNTIDIGALSNTALFIIIMVMFIGAPAGGTGGGIKSTTFAVMMLVLRALLGGNEDVNVFERRLSRAVIYRAFGIGLMAALWLVVVVTILTYTENLPLLNLIFEAVSALGTVGLSTGITADLSLTGRLVIAVAMLVGRLGPLTVGLSIAGHRHPADYHFPTEDVFVG